MFCKKCGARIPDDHTRFCQSCGEPVVHEKPGPSKTEKILWIVIGVMILVAAFVLLRNQPNSSSVKSLSSPRLNLNPGTATNTQKTHPVFHREVSAPPPPPASSTTPVQTPSSILYKALVKGLAGSRYSIEVKYLQQKKSFRVKATILYDNQPREVYLNAFSRFFAICYGDRTQSLIVAAISLKQENGTPLMTMGIGQKVAAIMPASTWRQFSNMGPSLLNWVRNHEVKNPSSPEMACYFNQNAEF